MRLSKPTALAAAVLLGACAGSADQTEHGSTEQDTEEDIGVTSQALSGTVPLNAVCKVVSADATKGTPLYSDSAGTTILRRLATNSAVKIVVSDPTNSRYKVGYQYEMNPAMYGWINASELSKVYENDTTLSSLRTDALARARSAMGFSYWWGHGLWPKAGTQIVQSGSTYTSNIGTCTKTATDGCPNCTHAATGGTEYGSDCSHFVSTIWGVNADTNPETDAKGAGYQASAFTSPTANWSAVTFANAKGGDVGAKSTHVWLVAARRNTQNVFKSLECIGCDWNCAPSSHTVADTDTTWKMMSLIRANW